MNRAVRHVPGLFAVAAVALAVFGFRTDLLTGSWQNVVLIVSGIGACAIAWLVNRMPILFSVAVAGGGLRVVTLDNTPFRGSHDDLHLADSMASAVVGIVLIFIMAVALRYRRGDFDSRDTIDFVTVAIGASLAGWILVARPLISVYDIAPGVAVLSALYLPVAVMLFTFIADLWFAGLQRNRAMQFITLAAFTNLVGAFISTLSTVELIGVAAHTEVGLHGAAFLFLAAGLSHRDSIETVARIGSVGSSAAYPPFRLGLTAVCLTVPIMLLATIAPVGQADVVVRVLLLLALVATVLARLSVALSNHQRVRGELLDRVHRDELTGLPTRARFVDVVSDALETTWRSEFHPTIIQLNLDRFKNINDSLGHDGANLVLVAVADRLTEVADSFGGCVARTGGDDFVFVDSTTRTDVDAMIRVEAVRTALAAPVSTGSQSLFVTASIGVVVAPRNLTLNADELLRRADIATTKAKNSGRSGLSVFDDSMQAHLAHRMDVEHALHGAIGRNEMLLYHQPIVDISTGEVSGFEALMRWQRDGQIVAPLDFIPIAEETGIINELGAWALHEALQALRGWIDDGVIGPDTTMSVNVSPRQIADPNFADLVREAIEATGVPPHLLWLEMTESMMLEEPELAEGTLRAIREMGVRLAIDDFGTGYSSLSLLQQFPIQRLKIDRAFVNGIAEHGNDRSLVRTIIAMARSMDLDIVAEGVETVQQLQTLAELNCDKAQGFLISRPVPADAMRSTMVALDELTSLSLFGASSSALDEGGSSGIDTTTSNRFERAGAGPMGTSRPLGQPAF